MPRVGEMTCPLPSTFSCLYDDSHHHHRTAADNSDLWLFHGVPSQILQTDSLLLAKDERHMLFSCPTWQGQHVSLCASS